MPNNMLTKDVLVKIIRELALCVCFGLGSLILLNVPFHMWRILP